MNTRSALCTVIVAGLLASPAMVPTASADSRKVCVAAWKAMAASDQASTTRKAFYASCRASTARDAAAGGVPNVKSAPALAGAGCHDYSDCPSQQVVSDPK